MRQLNLTVIGATGRTGRHVLTEGIRRGHRITAFTRRPEALPDAAETARATRVTRVVQGDGRDLDRVRTAVDGADAVIAIVAANTRKGPHPAAEVSRTLVAAMTEAGVRRLVVTSAYPLVAERPRLPIAVLRAVFAAAYADAAAMEHTVSTSALDWSIVRLNRLLDAPARGGVHVSRDLLDRPTALTRADAAATLLDITEDDSRIRSALNIAGTR